MPARRQVPARLPAWEQGLYWITEVVTIVYMLYSLYNASEKARRRNEPIRMEEGWAILGRPRDAADFEWEFWSLFFWDVLPWLCGHVVLSQSLNYFTTFEKIRPLFLTLYAIAAITYLQGFYTVLFMCVHPVALCLVSKLGSTKAVWLTTVLFLTVLNYYEAAVAQWFYRYKAREDFNAWYMCVFVWANICQRGTAFALECVWTQQSVERARPQSPPGEKEENNSSPEGEESKDKKPQQNDISWPVLPEVPGWLDMFYYMFYFPLFFTGPLIVYNNFHRQAKHQVPCTKARLKDIVLRLVSVMFWAVMNGVMLHYIYAHAINSSSKVLAKQSRWTVAAIGYILGQFFMMKYLVLFGLPAQLSRLDGFEPPAVPACISYIYCYSDMWKSFDRGLYDFMKRYIFIPTGGSRAGLFRQVAGSVLCFAYVFYWHGAEYYLFLWCVLNFIETSLEQMGAWLEKTAIVKRVLYDRLSPAGVRRVRAVMSVPVFLMSVFAIFYFFGGTESGLVFLRKLLIRIPWGSLVVFVVLVYCAIQNAMEVERLGMAKLKVQSHQD
ncbi:protein-cysteine N-palmitoyltransferase HHAT-like [Littorina saxatilis]|uniref:Uncharacterized protein n=1 Tax=Littorina saxatilis TaxID=31220 RepID=A0AAN9BL01_9CAEN